MPKPLPVPPRLRLQPFSRAQALELIGRGQLAGPSFQPVTQGAYWTAGQEINHGRRIQALRSLLPTDAVLRGLSAAWAHGLRLAAEADPVEVVLDHRRRVRSRSILLVSGETLDLDEVVRTDLGPATSHARTAFDLARRLPFADAVAAADALLRAGTLPASALLDAVTRHPGLRGRRQAAQVAAVADPRAESPRESQLRVALAEAGLPMPTPQVEVKDGSLLVARLDLAWPEQLVAIEYDGAHHREARQHSRDLARHNRLRSLGWLVYQVDAGLWGHPGRFGELVSSVRAALAERSPR